MVDTCSRANAFWDLTMSSDPMEERYHIYLSSLLPNGTPVRDNFRGNETRNHMNPVMFVSRLRNLHGEGCGGHLLTLSPFTSPRTGSMIYFDVPLLDGSDTLKQFNIAIENDHLQWIFPQKIVIFHSCLELPEAKLGHIIHRSSIYYP